MQTRLRVLPPGPGLVLQRLGRGRRLGGAVRGGRPGLAGGGRPQPPTFDLGSLLGLAALAAQGSASDAGAGPAGHAALERRAAGGAAAAVQREEPEHPVGLGSGRFGLEDQQPGG